MDSYTLEMRLISPGKMQETAQKARFRESIAKISNRRVMGFYREKLPHPGDYFRSESLKLIGRAQWKSALCPFHVDNNPSLRVHIGSGAFRCMACGVKGGDVLSFHMQKYRLSFVEAAKALGAWGQE